MFHQHTISNNTVRVRLTFPIFFFSPGGLRQILGLTLLCGFIFPCSAQQSKQSLAKNELLAGIAKRNITPDIAVRNWVTGEPYDIVHDSIFVRAMAISDGHDTSVLINWELVDAGESATLLLRSRVSQALGIPAGHILVNASHNHSAPWSPVYHEGMRGKEKDPWWAVRYMPAQYDYAPYRTWMEVLMVQSLEAVKAAVESMQMVTVWLGKSDIASLVQNRRPRPSSWGFQTSRLPENYNYKHEDWDPDVLGNGMSFGPVDRALTAVFFENREGETVATLLHMTAHAVAIYPFMDGISGDWPGETLRKLDQVTNGESLFLQGTAGDINPGRRGSEAVSAMAEELCDKVLQAKKYCARLEVGPLLNGRAKVGLPLTQYGKKITGIESLPVEVQVIAIGPLALVSLPGEPMTALGMKIRETSPYPQTLVLGYTNGKGVYYVGMPGEKAHGGYETGAKTNIGVDNAGLMLVETAKNLLHEVYQRK